MGFIGSFVGLVAASAVFLGADLKEEFEKIDKQQKYIAEGPCEPVLMRQKLERQFENEWHRGDNTHFPEHYLPAFESDPEVLGWWIKLLAEREIRRQGYRSYPISIQGNFNRVYNNWKERQNWVR